jgi:hypothetical protein
MKAESEFIESYWSILRFLNDKIKLALFERLKKSLYQSKTLELDRQKEAFGAWVGSESAEELIETVSNSRNFTRRVEEL